MTRMYCLILATLITACGADSSDNTAALPSIDGTWTGCQSDANSSWLTKINNEAGKQTVTATLYGAGTNCTGDVAMQDVNTYDYTVTGAGADGTVKVNLTLSAMTRTQLLDFAVTIANKAPGQYGYTDWAVGVAKDVTGRAPTAGDVPNPAVGDITYTLIKLDGDKLYVGDESTGDKSTEATRPTKVKETTLTKQK